MAGPLWHGRDHDRLRQGQARRDRHEHDLDAEHFHDADARPERSEHDGDEVTFARGIKSKIREKVCRRGTPFLVAAVAT
jgi:hypothetical protein